MDNTTDSNLSIPVKPTRDYDSLCPVKRVYTEMFFLYVAGIGSTCLIGLVLNSINLMVLGRQKMELKSHLMLRVLAVSDMVFLVTCLVHFVLRHLVALSIYGTALWRRRDRELMPLWYWYSLPPYFMALQNRNWIIVLVTTERLLAILAPFWSRVSVTRSRIYKVVVVNAVIAVGMQMSRFFDRVQKPSTFKCAEPYESVYILQPWGQVQDRIGYVIMVIAIPLTLLYVMNIALIIALYRISAKRAQLHEGDLRQATAQRQATLMVIAMLVVFTVCETPAGLDRIARLAGAKFSSTDPFFHCGRRVGLLLIVMDSAVNFLAYCASNRRFRNTLRHLCGKFFDRRPSLSSIFSVNYSTSSSEASRSSVPR